MAEVGNSRARLFFGTLFLAVSFALSACVGGSPTNGVEGGTPTEPAESEDLSWIPVGFNQIGKDVAYRPLEAGQGPECETPFCANFEVATAQTCRVMLDIVTYDAEMRVVEELWDTARVRVGAIGIIQVPIKEPDEIEYIDVFDGTCYFEVSG